MVTTTQKQAAAKLLGKLGGLARKDKLTPERRSEIARKGAEVRHNKKEEKSK